MNDRPQTQDFLPEKRHSLKEMFYAFMVILPPAFLFALKQDLPHVFIIAFLLLLLPFFFRKPLPATDRPIVYCITASMVLTALPDLMVSTDDARIGLFDILVRSSLVLPFLVYTAALGGLFVSSGRINGARAALAAGGMLLCGDRFNSRDVYNVYLSFLDPLLHEYSRVYIYCAVISGIFLPCFLRAGSGKSPGKKTGAGKGFYILQGIAVTLCGILILSAAVFIQNNPSFLRSMELYFMRMGAKGLRSGKNTGKSMLSRKVDLRSPLPPYFGQLPDEILFRAKAKFPPGLLRSGVYVRYENGRWLPAFTSGTAPAASRKQELESVRRTGILSFNTFRMPDGEREENTPDPEMDRPNEKQQLRMEIFPDSLITSGIFPMPGNTVRIDAVADSAEVSQNGILHLKHWKKDGGITFFVRSAEPEAAYNVFLRQDKKTGRKIYGEKLSSEEAAALTRVPRWAEEYKKKFPFKNLKNLSGREKVGFIKKYLVENYSYSLYVPVPGRKEFFKDPVLRFLEDTRKGHCELFASAAVLLCRSMGLPARYVTGFICEEKSPAGDYYYCRLAHAWGEVWLENEEKWVTIDAACADGDFALLTGRKRSFLRNWFDLLKYRGQEFFALVRRGYFAEGIFKIFAGIFELAAGLFTSLYGLLLLAVSAAVLFILYRRKRKKGLYEGGIFSAEKLFVLEKFLAFEKKFALLSGRKRGKETPTGKYYRNFSLPDLTSCMEKYEILRFGKLEKKEFDTIFLSWDILMKKILRELKERKKKGEIFPLQEKGKEEK